MIAEPALRYLSSARLLPGGLLFALLLARCFFPPGARAQDSLSRPPVQAIRFAEDNAFLADPARRTEVFDAVKYIGLRQNPTTYLSLGADARYLLERFVNPAGEVRNYDALRSMIDADLHVAGDRFRVFAQAASGTLLDGIPARPIDVDRLFVLNLFGEARLWRGGADAELRLRAGRFEMQYGNARLVAIREGPNVRQYWEGAQARLRAGAWAVEAFATSYGENRPGVFDDPVFFGEQLFWGVYATHELTAGGGAAGGDAAGASAPKPTLDLYYLGVNDEDRPFFSHAGAETRHTFGTRLAGQRGAFAYDGEVTGQLGRAGPQQIRAYGAGLEMTYRVSPAPGGGRRAPGVALGLKVDYWSGDRDSTDARLNGFNPLYPQQGYYRGAAQLFPSNFFDVTPSLALSVSPGVTLGAGYGLHWRSSREDGIYITGAGIPTLAPSPGAAARAIGRQLDATLGWTPDRHLYVDVIYSWFDAAGFVVETPDPTEVRHYLSFIVGYRI